MKRIKNITLHLTEQEAELLEVLAEMEERKTAELARILLNKKALELWTQKQTEKHNPNAQPLTPLKFDN